MYKRLMQIGIAIIAVCMVGVTVYGLISVPKDSRARLPLADRFNRQDRYGYLENSLPEAYYQPADDVTTIDLGNGMKQFSNADYGYSIVLPGTLVITQNQSESTNYGLSDITLSQFSGYETDQREPLIRIARSPYHITADDIAQYLQTSNQELLTRSSFASGLGVFMLNDPASERIRYFAVNKAGTGMEITVFNRNVTSLKEIVDSFTLLENPRQLAYSSTDYGLTFPMVMGVTAPDPSWLKEIGKEKGPMIMVRGNGYTADIFIALRIPAVNQESSELPIITQYRYQQFDLATQKIFPGVYRANSLNFIPYRQSGSADVWLLSETSKQIIAIQIRQDTAGTNQEPLNDAARQFITSIAPF
jgi:hypothetical protein